MAGPEIVAAAKEIIETKGIVETFIHVQKCCARSNLKED